MGQSSNTLWHQTTKNGLKGILNTQTFYYSYSIEDILSIYDKERKFAIPMISLCDIPLSEQGNYLDKYGGYAIGVSREWGVNNRFTPVTYCYKNSIPYLTLKTLVGKLLKEMKNREDINNLLNLALSPFFYSKFVEGPLRKKNIKNYRFYDERELRLCPYDQSFKKEGYKLILTQKEYDTFKRGNQNSSSTKIGVSISITDIKYIIVKKEDEIQEFRELLNKIGDVNNRIVVLTGEQIREDIIGEDHTVREPEIDDKEIKNTQFYEFLNELFKQKSIGETFFNTLVTKQL